MPPTSGFRLPNDSNRSTILGKTGSGKTLAGIWQLSKRDFDKMPWVIVDYKRDRTLNQLGAKEISVDYLPRNPGLYIMHPKQDDREEIDDFLWQVYEKGGKRSTCNVGLFFDETSMVTGLKSFRTILTQGRAKHIPVIMCSQRPAWLDRYVFSESDYFQLFWLIDSRDRKTVQSFLPFDVNQRLPDFNSFWYDVGRDSHYMLKPVPGERELIQTFRGLAGLQRRIL